MREPVHWIWTAALAGLPLSGLGAAASESSQSPAAPDPSRSWSWSASASVREAFDSNVYLQSVTDLAHRESFVTTLLPQAGFAWKPSEAFHIGITYSPEFAFFHDEPGENYVLHRGGLTLDGKVRDTRYEISNTLSAIDGSHLGPVWTGAGGPPAAGGIALRDRRDATILRSGLKVTQTLGSWTVRPVAQFYLHDFCTLQSLEPGYQNYVDRNEFVAGADFGRKAIGEALAFVGYRFGFQDQSQLLQFPEEYDNHFHRLLAIVEGKLFPWLNAAATAGPEFRRYGSRVPAGFGDHDELNLYVDACLTATPDPGDTISVSVRQYEQPGFSGRSTYEDLTYDLAWRRKLTDRLTVGVGGRAYNTDFLAPAARNDWILSGNGLLNYRFTPHFSAEASYQYEKGLSEIPFLPGREFERHLVALGAKYTFQ